MALTAASFKPTQRQKQLRKSILKEKQPPSGPFGGSMQPAIPSILVEDNQTYQQSNIRREASRNDLGPLKYDETGTSGRNAQSRRSSRRMSTDLGGETNEKKHVSFENQGGGASTGSKRRGSVLEKFHPGELGGPSTKRHGSLFDKSPHVPDWNGMKTEKDEGTPKRRHDPQRALDLMSLKYKGQALSSKVGKSAASEMGNFMGIQRRRSTINLYSNADVLDVLSSIQEAQKKREQERIRGQLDTIRRRVQRTLSGMGMELEDDEDDSLSVKPLHFSMFDTRAEREKMRERNYIIGKVEQFEEKSILKKQYLTELEGWFEDHLNMCSDVITMEEMKELIRNSQELHSIISKSLETFMKNGEEVVEKGSQLLEETSKIIAERRAQMAKRTKKERIIVYDDKTLLQDPLKWESAAKTIISVFEDSQKMIRNIMFKNALKLSQRQFEYIQAASDKRYKDLDDKKKQCVELQGKLHSAKLQNDRSHREIEEQKRKMEKLTNELTDTKHSVEKLQNRNKELNQEIAERNSKIRLLEEQLREKLKTPTPPPTPPPPPEPEKVIVKVVDSATELRLKEVEEELEATKAELKKLQNELRLVTEKLVSERELCKSLQEKVTELENIPTPEPIVIAAPATPVVEAPPDTDKDSSYYKTLMAGMKNEYAAELEKVKGHIMKEKTRGEAGLRKVELQHKEQLSNIQKDIIRMLRGILHFRDRMMTCLEKESLFDQAQALHDLGDLVKDKLSPDPRELLAVIVSTVIDYLHNMEGILYNAFKAMRILMRYQIDKQVEIEVDARMSKLKQEQEMKKVAKEVQKKQKVITGAQKDVKHLAKRLKKAKNKLKRCQKDLETVPTDKRYRDLLQRYNHVIGLYKNMCKEMELLQSDFHDTMKKKLEERETMVITQIKMEIKQQRAITEEQLKLSIIDKRENLRLLSKAYEDNKISKDLYKLASTMITKAMEIPRLKLQNLIEQYITYRTVEESKNRVQQVLQEEDSVLMVDTRREMELYIDQMDEKFNSSMSHWRVKMKQLDFEKHDLNKRIFTLFNEVLLETGVLLIHPLLKDTSKRNIMAQATGSVTRKKMKQLLFRKVQKFKTFRDMPNMIQGSSIPIQPAGQPLWTMNPNYHPSEPKPTLVAPHMLAYNINGPKIQATRQFRKNSRQAQFRGTVDLKKTESFNIKEGNILQHIRHYSGNRMNLVMPPTY